MQVIQKWSNPSLSIEYDLSWFLDIIIKQGYCIDQVIVTKYDEHKGFNQITAIEAVVIVTKNEGQ